MKEAYEKSANAGKLLFKNNLYVERGPYDIVSVMDESNDKTPYVINGPVIDLFDPTLPVLSQKTVEPGSQAFLYNVHRVKDKTPKVLAAAARIYDQQTSSNSYSFTAKSPVKTINAMRVLLPAAPKETTVTDNKGQPITVNSSWDESSHTCFLGFDNSPDGIKVSLKW